VVLGHAFQAKEEIDRQRPPERVSGRALGKCVQTLTHFFTQKVNKETTPDFAA